MRFLVLSQILDETCPIHTKTAAWKSKQVITLLLLFVPFINLITYFQSYWAYYLLLHFLVLHLLKLLWIKICLPDHILSINFTVYVFTEAYGYDVDETARVAVHSYVHFRCPHAYPVLCVYIMHEIPHLIVICHLLSNQEKSSSNYLTAAEIYTAVSEWVSEQRFNVSLDTL